jgi:DNA-binding NarL/FixJ family response regulator
MSKPKLAWYETNIDYITPVQVYLSEKFEVRIFSNPDEAEAEIIEFKPDIIIFDYRMPFISGIEMYHKLMKKQLQFKTLFYSIWANDNATIQEIKSAGINDDAIIDKRLDCESFSKKVSDFFDE